MNKQIQTLVFFLFLVAIFLVMNRSGEKATPIIPTPTETMTIVPTPLPTLTPLPTPTMVPPLPVNIGEQPQVVLPSEGGAFNDHFFTGTICATVPALTQPAMNYNLIVATFYKGNRVEVTGTSQFWARIAQTSTGQVLYIPLEYVLC